MATASFEELKARVEALGFELFRYSESGARDLYVMDPNTHELVFAHTSDDSGFNDWLAERENTNGGDTDDTPLDRARDDAQEAAYEIRNLVYAALALTEHDNSAEDGRLAAVLRAARDLAAKLADDLDSVNFGKAS